MYGTDVDGDDVWHIFEDGKITFNSKDEAIEYFLSFGRQMLGSSRDQRCKLTNYNWALHQTWMTQIEVRDPSELTDLLLYYKRGLQTKNETRLEDNTAEEVYRVSVTESTHVPSLETMVKCAGRDE